MIHIIVDIAVSEENRTGLLGVLTELSVASQKESGNLRYEHFIHPSDPTRLVLLEQWESATALEAHEATEHFLRLLPQLDQLAEGITITKL